MPPRDFFLPPVEAAPEEIASALFKPPTRKVRRAADDGPEAWTLSVNRIFEDNDLRFDAIYHDPNAVSETIRRMEESGIELKRLGDLADVVLPGQFERVWARDSEHGAPYLNATDLLSLFARGVQSGEMRYLSRVSQVDFDALIIRRNMILVTCSGTIGRVYHVPERLDGWAATHDLIRIVPGEGLSGYLYAWCLSPAAQIQIVNPTHGAQIDHITDDQLREIIVPMPDAERVRKINAEVIDALEARESALSKINQAVTEIA